MIDFLLHPSTWTLILIFGVMVFVRGATRMAATGLVCYLLSFALSNAYYYVPYAPAVLLWQGGLLAVLAMYSIVGRVWWPAPLAGLSIGIYILDIVSRYNFEFMISALIAATVYQIYWRPMYPDVLAKMVWGVVLIFEGWSALEVIVCRFFSGIYVPVPEIWAESGGTSVCIVAFGDGAQVFITAVTLTLLAWIKWRWNQTQTLPSG